jgi:hypothetical protein
LARNRIRNDIQAVLKVEGISFMLIRIELRAKSTQATLDGFEGSEGTRRRR